VWWRDNFVGSAIQFGKAYELPFSDLEERAAQGSEQEETPAAGAASRN